MKALNGGIQRVNISPPIGTPLGGYLARKGVSEGVHDELFATVLVLKQGKMSLALITTDVIAIPSHLDRKIRRYVRESTGIPEENILIAATHTHSGPALLFGYQGLANKSYQAFLCDAVAGCATAAWKTLCPIEVGVGTGKLHGLGVNRREPKQGPIDPEVGVLRIERENGTLGIFFNFTCHPTVLGPNNLLISRDYPGFAVNAIEQVIGGVAMFTNGAAGDINPGHSADLSALGVPLPGRTFSRAQSLGLMLAGEVIKTAMRIEPKGSAQLEVRSKRIRLPLKTLPSPQEAEKVLKEKMKLLEKLKRKNVSPDRITAAEIEKFHAECLLRQVHKVQRQRRKYMWLYLQSIRIGECAIFAFPGELFVEIGLRIKRRSPFNPTYIVGYANGYFGYLPTRKAFEEGGYEVMMSHFAPGADELVEEAAVRMLNSLV